MEVGCYTLDLYCDNAQGHAPLPVTFRNRDDYTYSFSGETYRECKRKAKKAGWTWHRGGRLLCPLCSRMKMGVGK